MLSTAADVAQLATLAPWLAVALLSLATSWWVYRQQAKSGRAQGERLGELERVRDSERDRRRQVESVLCDLGIPLPYWPADGPDQPRPRRRYEDDRYDDDQDQDHAPDRLSPETEVRRVPVPPLDPSPAMARHRRSASL